MSQKAFADSSCSFLALCSPPQLPVKRAVLDGFADVVGADVFHAGEVGDGAGHFQDAAVGAGAQVVFGRIARLARMNKVMNLSPCGWTRS